MESKHMVEKRELSEVLGILSTSAPESYAIIKGSREYPQIQGIVRFYSIWDGTLVAADIYGLPQGSGACSGKVFGFHVHEGNRCLGNASDPFAQTKGHYNPGNCEHPEHAGDMPPLFGNDGFAMMMFYTDRFFPETVVGRTVVIHSMPDDFKTQPSGDSGMKIACGEIKENKM